MAKKNKASVEIKAPAFRLERIKIVNYKGIDSLEMVFPRPRIEGKPDVVVIGSENGLGKTSILECCALLFLAISIDGKEFEMAFDYMGKRLRGVFERDFVISGDFLSKRNTPFSLELKKKKNRFLIICDVPNCLSEKAEKNINPDSFSYMINQILGRDPNPLLFQNFLFFNSFRKTQEGAPELGMLVRSPKERFRPRRWDESVISTFKVQVLRSVMLGNPTLFNEMENENSDEILSVLNGLLIQYAGVKIHRLDPSYDNTIEIQVEHRQSGHVFSFDGLSSGQKEIISTLFLTWDSTRNQPRIVLIDEPELHMNRDWQQTYTRDLFKIAPHNQYIFATHSVELAESVEQYQRILLTR